MVGSDRVGGGIEVDEVSAARINGADAQPCLAGIDPVEIYQALEGAFEHPCVIEARRLKSAVRMQPVGRLRQTENVRGALEDGGCRPQLVESSPLEISSDPIVSLRRSPL